MPHASRRVQREREAEAAREAEVRVAEKRSDITQWDDEELEQGRLKNAKGRFDGRPPKITPKLFRQIRD